MNFLFAPPGNVATRLPFRDGCALARWLACVAAFLFGTCGLGWAQEVKIEWQTCVKFDTLFASKQGCYILDTKTRQQKIAVQIGVGINVNAGTVLIGGGASSMLVVNMEYPATGDSKADLERAIKKCEADMRKPENQKKILELYKKSQGRSPDAVPASWSIPALSPIPVSDLPEKVRQILKTTIPA